MTPCSAYESCISHYLTFNYDHVEKAIYSHHEEASKEIQNYFDTNRDRERQRQRQRDIMYINSLFSPSSSPMNDQNKNKNKDDEN